MSTAEMEQLTSGASNRIIPLLKALRTSLLFVHTVFLSLLLFFFRRRRRCLSESLTESTAKKRKSAWRREEEDTFRRRALAEELHTGDGDCRFRRDTFLFYGVRQSALFCRSWFPVSGNPRAILVIIHGLNEHSGRYADFARQLTSCNFGVYAMDWIGHGGSDGLHGYVPSLDHVVADTDLALDATRIVGVDLGQGLREVDIKKYIKVEKVPGGQLEDSVVLKGVMINKDVIAPGKMRRKIVNPRIMLLDCPLEYKKGENQTNAEAKELIY